LCSISSDGVASTADGVMVMLGGKGSVAVDGIGGARADESAIAISSAFSAAGMLLSSGNLDESPIMLIITGQLDVIEGYRYGTQVRYSAGMDAPAHAQPPLHQVLAVPGEFPSLYSLG